MYISSSSSAGERVSMSVAAVDISAVIAIFICVAIAMAISEICDKMAVVIATFISFMISIRISRSKLLTSFCHERGNDTGSLNMTLRLFPYPLYPCPPLPLIVPRPAFPPLSEGLEG